jgi:hypothetical protein
MLGPFMWGRRARPHPIAWGGAEPFDFFEGEHDGYRAASGVVHRRSVVFGRLGYWLLLDRIEGTGTRRVRVGFQLAPGLERLGGEDLRFADSGGCGLAIDAWLPEGMDALVAEGEEDPPRGWVSPGFGERNEAPRVVFEGAIELPAALLFAVVPSSKGGSPVVTADGPIGPDGAAAVFEGPAGRDRCLFGPDARAGGDEVFEGLFGFVAERGRERTAFGMGVEHWSRKGADVDHRDVHNELLGSGQGEE